MSLASLREECRQAALKHIDADEKVLYCETPTVLDANLIPFVFLLISTTLFVIQIALFFMGSLDMDFLEVVRLPDMVENGIVIMWYPVVLLFVAVSYQRYLRRFVVLSSKKIIYRAGDSQVKTVTWPTITGCFASDAELVVSLKDESVVRLGHVNASVLESKINAILTAVRKKQTGALMASGGASSV